jgi:hypothetical protein
MKPTLKQRLDECGYTREMEQQKKDRELIETAKRDLRMQGKPFPQSLLDFEKECDKCDKSLAELYERTVAIFDSRNDLEFTLLQTYEGLQLRAEEYDATDPEKAAKVREFIEKHFGPEE